MARFYRGTAMATLLLFAGCTTVQSLDVKGTITPPPPKGCKDLGGTIVGTGNVEMADDYGVSLLGCGTENIFTLNRLIMRENGHPIFVVVDQISLPAGRPLEDYVLPGFCDSSLHPGDHTIFAVGQWVTQPEYFSRLENIAGAWRVDLSKEQMVPVSTAGLRCEVDIPD